jgi:hypothetical protein
MVSPGNGHVVICFGPNDVSDPPVPEILDYEQKIRPEVERRLGPRSGLVYSNFIVYRSRSETEQDFYVGARRDVLRRVDGAWKIARRKLILDQNVLSAKNVSIFF